MSKGVKIKNCKAQHPISHGVLQRRVLPRKRAPKKWKVEYRWGEAGRAWPRQWKFSTGSDALTATWVMEEPAVCQGDGRQDCSEFSGDIFKLQVSAHLRIIK